MRSKVRPRFHDPPRKDGPIKKLTNNTHNNIQEDATCWGAGYQFRLTFCKDVGITSADAIRRMGSEHPTRKWKTPILARLTLHYPSPSGKGMGARSNWSTRNNAVQYKKNFLRRNNDALVSHDKKNHRNQNWIKSIFQQNEGLYSSSSFNFLLWSCSTRFVLYLNQLFLLGHHPK